MKNPLVTVIMIVKNGERFIKEALQSVFAQNYRPIEILVIDGKSTDKTCEIANSFEEIRILTQQDFGVSDAYNQGINDASGEFVAFLSHDDIWTSDKLSVQIKYMNEHPQLLYTNAHIEYFIEPGSGIPDGFRKEWLHGPLPARIMETLVARKQVFEKVGVFNTSLNTAEDVDWYSRAASMEIPTYMIEKVLLHKRVHDRNVSMEVDKNNQNLLMALRYAVKRKKSNST